MTNIAKMRKAAGFTQMQFAKLLNVRQSTVSGWETGRFLPESIKLPEIARVLNCDIIDLFGSDDDD